MEIQDLLFGGGVRPPDPSQKVGLEASQNAFLYMYNKLLGGLQSDLLGGLGESRGADAPPGKEENSKSLTNSDRQGAAS